MITPGELHNGMMIAVIDGKPLVTPEDASWAEKEDSGGLVWFTTNIGRQSDDVPNVGRVFVVAAIQLPMVLCVDVITKQPAVFDARKLVFREISKEYARAYRRLFRVKEAAV
jgi:hypothetical protein